MGLFTPKPYKMNVLSTPEKKAVEAALEVGILAAGSSGLGNVLRTARSHFLRGALTEVDLAAVIACTEASLTAIADGSTDNQRSTELKKRAVAEVVLALALTKLKAML